MLETVRLSEQELLGLWAFGLGAFMWQAGEDRCYLHDLKVAILTAAERDGIDAIADKLKALGKTEFSVSVDIDRYKVPPRWFNQIEHNTNPELQLLYEKPIEDAIERINQMDNGDKQYSSDSFDQSISLVAKRMKIERPAHFNRHVNRLLEIIEKRSTINKWASVRVSVYRELFNLVTEHSKLEILRKLIASIEFDSRERYWVGNAVDNLDTLCRYQAIAIGETALLEGFRRNVDTHELWVNGNGFLPEVQKIAIPTLEQIDIAPTSWSQYAVRYLFRILKSDNGSRIEAALRGLWAITTINPSDMSYISDKWGELPSRAKEWILILVERVAVCLPDAFNFFSEIVSQSYNGTDLRLKLQAWVVLQALERSNGQQCGDWRLNKHPNNEQIISLSVEDQVGVLDIPSIPHGSIASIGGARTIHSILRLLDAATVDDVKDIERKYSSYVLKHVPSIKDHQMENLKKSDGEMQVLDSSEADLLMDIIYSELYRGRWCDIPIVRLAQALITGDDPFILLSSPQKAIDADNWVIDYELDALIKDQETLKNKLLQNIHAGLSGDEIVLAAVLFTYSRSHDVKMVYNMAIKDERFLLHSATNRSTFNGRSFAMYDIDRFDPLIYMEPVTTMGYESRGIGNFVNQSILTYPPHIWTTVFGFEPSPADPTIWLHNNQPIIRFDYYHGQTRDLIQDRLYRQPVLQRWVCSREKFEKIVNQLGFVSSPFSTLRVDQLK